MSEWLISYGNAWLWNHECPLWDDFFPLLPSQIREWCEQLKVSLKNAENGSNTGEEASMMCLVWWFLTGCYPLLGEVWHNCYFGSDKVVIFANRVFSKERAALRLCLQKMLASGAQLVGVSFWNWKVSGSIPGQGTYQGCGFNPCSGHIQPPVQVHTEGNWPMLLSHINVFLSPSLSLTKQWKNILWWGLKKKDYVCRSTSPTQGILMYFLQWRERDRYQTGWSEECYKHTRRNAIKSWESPKW